VIPTSHVFRTDHSPSFVQSVAVIEVDTSIPARACATIFVATLESESRHLIQILHASCADIEGDPQAALLEQSRIMAEAIINSEFIEPALAKLGAAHPPRMSRLIPAQSQILAALRHSDAGRRNFKTLLALVANAQLKASLTFIDAMPSE
jgi:hypothetical protein